MEFAAVLIALDALDRAGVRHWVAGGWGVDLLVGRQTRPHRDLDLAIGAEGEAAALTALGRLGFTVETDWRPTRVELAGPGEQWVDLHPVVFDADGFGRQADLDGGHFAYPPTCFTTGRIAGVDRAVGCLSVEQQVLFHSGYAPRERDRHDLRLLAGLAAGDGRYDREPS
jgi:lincosamide nucleotidyltransferase A/C/D/E